MMHPQYPRSSSGMRGGRNNSNSMMSSQQHNAGNVMAHDNTRRSRSSSRPKSRSRSKSLGRRQNGTGQSSLSAHIQQQMEARPRRGERDPTPLSRSAHNKSAPGLNYNGQAPLQQQQFSSPPRRNSAAMPRRNQSTNNVDDLSPSSSEERAAIAANLAKNSFSAHQNLQKLIDEQRERELHRMDHHHAQQNMMQVYHPMHPQNQQQMQVYHPQHHQQQEQQYDPSAPSSVAAVHQELPQHQTPLKLMVGQDNFTRCSFSTMTPLTPSTVELESNNAALSSPDVVGHQGYIPQIRRVTDNAGRNGGYNHHDQQQHQQQLEPRRRSATSPKRPNRDHLNVVPRQPNFDEEQLNAIAAEHPDAELAQSIAKIMAFQRKSTAQGGPSQSRQIVSYDDDNGEHPPRRSKSQLRMDAMDKNDSSEIKNEKVARPSFFSNSTAPTTISSLNSGSLFASSEPSSNNHNSASFQTPPNSTGKAPQIQRQNSSTPRYLDKETLYNHLQDAPRESRVLLTRLIENLQSENQRLNELTMTQGNQIVKLESEIGGLLRELLRYRREFGEMTTVAEGVGSEGDVSSEHATAATPTPSAVGMSSPSRQVHSSSRVETVRQDSVTQINEDEELEVVPPYVKSKSLHEETDRPGRTAAKRRSITSAPILSSPSSGGASSKGSFDHKMDMLKKFQLISPSSQSNSVDNDSRTRRSYSDRTADDSFHTAVESIFDPNVSAKQRLFKEEKKADTEATLRWSGLRDDPQIDGEGSIDEEQLRLMQQQRQQDENHQDEVSPETRLRSNSLEDVFEPQHRRSCFVEQKGGSTSSGSVSGSVPSMTDTVGSCSWSYSTPESGGER